jgi:hypothetical protein
MKTICRKKFDHTCRWPPTIVWPMAPILPEPFTTPTMRALPVALVLVAMFYWLWRVRGRRTFVTRTIGDLFGVR